MTTYFDGSHSPDVRYLCVRFTPYWHYLNNFEHVAMFNVETGCPCRFLPIRVSDRSVYCCNGTHFTFLLTQNVWLLYHFQHFLHLRKISRTTFSTYKMVRQVQVWVDPLHHMEWAPLVIQAHPTGCLHLPQWEDLPGGPLPDLPWEALHDSLHPQVSCYGFLDE